MSGSNPTFDYYVAPRLEAVPHRIVDIESHDSAGRLFEPGDYVLVCRYLSLRWAMNIIKNPAIIGIGYFFDDDLIAFVRDPSIPLPYRLHIVRRAVLPFRIIRNAVTDVFVSTPSLRDRYGAANAVVLHPVPSAIDLAAAPPSGDRPLRIAMHAQLSHLAEHAFAARVMCEVARRIGPFEMDVVGPSAASALWRGVPGLDFRPETDWTTYRRDTARRPVDLLIAPLLDTTVNTARAPTKAIDAVRMGAAAAFSSLAPYAELEGAAVLVGGDEAAWCDAVTALAANADRRRATATTLRDRVRSWRDLVHPLVEMQQGRPA